MILHISTPAAAVVFCCLEIAGLDEMTCACRHLAFFA
jgi:hypothetical protein